MYIEHASPWDHSEVQQQDVDSECHSLNDHYLIAIQIHIAHLRISSQMWYWISCWTGHHREWRWLCGGWLATTGKGELNQVSMYVALDHMGKDSLPTDLPVCWIVVQDVPPQKLHVRDCFALTNVMQLTFLWDRIVNWNVWDLPTFCLPQKFAGMASCNVWKPRGYDPRIQPQPAFKGQVGVG